MGPISETRVSMKRLTPAPHPWGSHVEGENGSCSLCFDPLSCSGMHVPTRLTHKCANDAIHSFVFCKSKFPKSQNCRYNFFNLNNKFSIYFNFFR